MLSLTLALTAHALAAPETQPADPWIAELIARLGDRSLAIRERAKRDLARIGRPARDALVAASVGGQPQRRANVRAVLAMLPLVDANDPPELQKLLTAYEAAPAVARVDHALRLLARGGDVGLKAINRIVVDADDDALWPLITAMPAADRKRLVGSPAFASIEPIGPARLYLVGAGLFDQDRLRAVAYLDRALGELKIAPPAARPAVAHLAELLAADSQLRADATRELQVRRDAAMLAPTRAAPSRLVLEEVPSDLFASYLAARVRLRTVAGLDEDLQALGLPQTDPISALIREAIAAPPLPAAAGEHPPGEDAAALRAVPTPVWEALDGLSPEDAVCGIEILRRGGAYELARTLAVRLAVFNDDLSDPPRTARLARLQMAQLPAAPTPQQKRAAQAQLRRTLFGPREVMREAGGVRDFGGGVDAPAPDYFVARRLSDVRLSTERRDEAAVTEALDQLAAVSIDESTLAIDVICLLEQHGRVAEADEVYAEFFDRLDAIRNDAPNSPVAMNQVAWFCARTGRNLEHGYDLAQKATKRSPKSAACMDTFAEAAFRLGHVAEAINAETRALALQPAEVFMHRQLDRFKAGLAEGDAARAMPSESWEP